jgi:hypothetical protein
MARAMSPLVGPGTVPCPPPALFLRTTAPSLLCFIRFAVATAEFAGKQFVALGDIASWASVGSDHTPCTVFQTDLTEISIPPTSVCPLNTHNSPSRSALMYSPSRDLHQVDESSLGWVLCCDQQLSADRRGPGPPHKQNPRSAERTFSVLI